MSFSYLERRHDNDRTTHHGDTAKNAAVSQQRTTHAPRDAMAETLEGATITYDSGSIPADETDAVEAFITAKRIEGCSEKP